MYLDIDGKIEKRIAADRAKGVFYGTPDGAAVRKDGSRDISSLFRPPFVRDISKIINLPVYSRLQDKTQVLSLYRNDDISHRMLHVQLVSRIARDISRALGLNTDLTEAIALGHDIGHTPFGHAGERMLDELSKKYAGVRFFHNVQSARALFTLYPCNLTLQTLDGVLSHNGEMEQSEYRPAPSSGFDGLCARIRACEEKGEGEVKKLVPETIEGCVVRVADMIAYLGKDRQDAERAGLASPGDFSLPISNSELINNISVDIINRSYAKGYLSMSDEVFAMLSAAKRENGELIYSAPEVGSVYEEIGPRFCELFEALLSDAKKPSGMLVSAHVRHICAYVPEYADERPERQVVDYIASMTDDYFVAAYEKLVGKPFGVAYKDYF